MRARRLLTNLLKREAEDPKFTFVPVAMIEDTTPELAMARNSAQRDESRVA